VPEDLKVVIGTPVNLERAYVFDKFLDNQGQIQKAYENCELVLTTSDKDFIPKIRGMCDAAHLRATVLAHDILKPDYARHWVWDVTSGREAIRRYAVSQTDADCLLFLDADMVFDADIIRTMVKNMGKSDALFNGCALRSGGLGLAGAGCLMLRRAVFEKVPFRCLEFPGGEVIFEDNLLEMDLFRARAGIKKGFYVPSDHYQDAVNYRHTQVHSVGVFRTISNTPLIRYALIRASVALKRNIPWRMKVAMGRGGRKSV
jgi:hypothetical protein